MNFQAKFKGKVSITNKEGPLGIIRMQGNPVEKKVYGSRREIPFQYQDEYDSPLSTKIYTNIDRQNNLKQNGSLQKRFQQNAQQMLSNPTSAREYQNQKQNQANNNLKFGQKIDRQDIDYIDMDQYDIVAVPKRSNFQQKQQVYNNQSDIYSMTVQQPSDRNQIEQISKSYVFRQTAEEQNFQAPIVKSHSFNNNNGKSKLRNSSLRPLDRNNELSQAGLKSLNYRLKDFK